MAKQSASTLNVPEKLRVLLACFVIPSALVLWVWVVLTSWTDLPEEFPTHWGPEGADAFGTAISFINGQSLAAAVAAGITAVVGIFNLNTGVWTSLARGLVSIGGGITAAISIGLYLHMLRSRGLSTLAAAELGASAGLLGAACGFLVLVVVTFLLLPKGRYPEAAEEAMPQ
ncbi:hypothetical protein QBL02_10050 [Leucobacter sp. UT-8R-CII-1-4]|uniref:hypothetical protein n=1 Tax=Leucobacter sp. UT-8R-CII-1-4 TaxID=3040075 RepID=UPI0024A8CAE0|nr:hypothetical protein [Leucobacter sp. UT-8R-CII-1-4]MDI6023885.1 hypothetical protein [Leucobacter sp. UT-8R-CII-1-4]